MEWGGEIRYSNNVEQASRGVLLSFKRNFDKNKIGHTVSFDHGNIILQEIVFSSTRLLLVLVYGPNEDSPHFYELLGDAIRTFMKNHKINALILQGDWNLTISPTEDTIVIIIIMEEPGRN